MYDMNVGCTSFQNYSNPKTPPTVCVTNTPLSRFFQRYLLQRAMSVFRFKLPENWSAEYFLYTLYCIGFLAVINTDKFGVIPQACTLYGYDVYYRPNKAQIANPLLKGIINPVIGVQCELVKLAPDYGGILDLVTFYADMMALTAQSAGVNLLNSKLSYLFTAKNKSASESFKRVFDKVSSGEPMVVIDEKLMNADGSKAWEAFTQNVGQNYIADRLLEDLRKLEQRFDTAIGIPNANTEKKERLITDEVNSNNVETYSLCELWLDEIQKCFVKVENMFGIKPSVDWRYKPNTSGGIKNGPDTK